MRKNLYLITIAMMLGFAACGNDQTEKSEIQENIEIEEDDDKEEEEKVSLKDILPDNKDKAWKEAYLDIVQDWNDEHGEDYYIGYQLAYINDDDIPELILIGDDGAWYGLDIYTYIDDKAVHMQIEGNNGQISPLTSPGCQGKSDTYIEKGNIYLQTSGMMGCSATTAYRMEGDTFVTVFYYTYADASWDESNKEPYSYLLEYTPVGGKRITIEKCVDAADEFYDVEIVPEAKDLEKEFGFSFKGKKNFGFDDAVDHDKILTELDYVPYENNSDYAKIYTAEIDDLVSQNKADKFALIYVDDDDVPELLAVNSNGPDMADDSVFLYTAYEDKISLLESTPVVMYKCHLDIAEKKNFIYTGGGDLSLNESFDKIQKGTAKTTFASELRSDFDDSTGRVTDHYIIEDFEVDADTYYNRVYSKLEKYSPFLRVEYNGIHQIYFEYMDGFIKTNEIRTIPYMTGAMIKEELASGKKPESMSEYYGETDPDDELMNGDYETLTNALKDIGFDTEKYGTDGFWVEVSAPDGYVNVRQGYGTEYPIISSFDNGFVLYIGECHVDEKGIVWGELAEGDFTGCVALSQTKQIDGE